MRSVPQADALAEPGGRWWFDRCATTVGRLRGTISPRLRAGRRGGRPVRGRGDDPQRARGRIPKRGGISDGMPDFDGESRETIVAARDPLRGSATRAAAERRREMLRSRAVPFGSKPAHIFPRRDFANLCLTEAEAGIVVREVVSGGTSRRGFSFPVPQLACRRILKKPPIFQRVANLIKRPTITPRRADRAFIGHVRLVIRIVNNAPDAIRCG